MSQIIEFTDLNQSELYLYTSLTDSQLRKTKENESNIFIAESPKVIERALDAGYKPLSFLMDKKHIHGDASLIIQRCPDIPVYTSESYILEKLTGFKLTRGVLSAMYRSTLPKVEDICVKAHRIAILEDITESTNIGAIFRSAAALNIDAILVTPSCCDPFCRRSIRVSMGNIFKIPWNYIVTNSTDWPINGINKIKSLGFKTVALALNDKSIRIDNDILVKENKLAIILGTEGTGLSSTTIANCDYTAKIPMVYGVDSLNVAAAAAIAFWQLRNSL